MTTHTTIIEEEKRAMRKVSFLEEETNRVISLHVAEDFLTTAMQRAYEAGAEERDTYWKERVRKEVASVCAKIDAKIIQRYRGFALDAGEVGFNDGLRRAKQIITKEDNLK